MNENLEYEEMEPTRAEHAAPGDRRSLKIAAMFLERLEQLGVYDNSLIFIVGDHGSGVADAGINVIAARRDASTRAVPTRATSRSFKAAGIPLILVKRMNASGRAEDIGCPRGPGRHPADRRGGAGARGASFPGDPCSA